MFESGVTEALKLAAATPFRWVAPRVRLASQGAFCWPLDDPTFSMLGAHRCSDIRATSARERTRHVPRRFQLSTCRAPRPGRGWQMMRHSGARRLCCEACGRRLAAEAQAG